MIENQEIEFHPWKWFAPYKSKILIVGTFPTAKRNWKYDFFYPNTSNFFWRVMAEIAKTKLQHFSGEESVIERKKILEKLFVAVTDMGNKVIRNEGSSSDEKLIPLEYMDIFKILEENTEINKIIFTSSSGRVNASKWFSQFLISKNVTYKLPKGRKPIKSEINFKGKTISLIIAYSTSPRAANRISFEKLVEMYRCEIA